jgi:hypothetical protein
LPNGESGSYDFTVTDTGGVDRDLTAFHFDAGVLRPRAARDFELSVVSGDLTIGIVATGNAPNITGGVQDWTNFDIDLSVLADSTLDANGTVTFRLAFTGGFPVGSPEFPDGSPGHHLSLDNVAISTGPFDFSLPGDYNGDDVVDAADYTVWRDGNSPDSSPAGYDLWRSNYGASQGATAAPLAATTAPEPSSLLLIAVSLGLAARDRRRVRTS